MGAPANEIERQIKETRDRIDENLGALERRAASNAMRYGRIAAVVIGLALAGGAGLVLYRRLRRPTLKDRLENMSVQSLRELADQVTARIKKPLPSVKLTVNEKSETEPGVVESIVRKVGPAIVGSASTALIERTIRPVDSDERHDSPHYD